MGSFAYGDHLSISTALAICQGKIKGILSTKILERVRRSQQIVGIIAAGEEVVYGINSGFGPLCTTKISPEKTIQLQYNILKSHSVGTGDPIPTEIAKMMLVLKAQSLAQGYSGIQVETLERIIWHIDQDIIPVVPSQGSVGASGDLAPLAHLFLPLIGLGAINFRGKIRDAASVLLEEGMPPLKLAPKEGLALINGTQFMASFAVMTVSRLHGCLSQADFIAAMMLEGLLGSVQPFMKQLHQLRPHSGAVHVAERISSLLEGSAIVASHKNCERVQDPYSLRCIPQVHGASRMAWLHLKDALEVELNAVTDNPVIIDQSLAISGGNFHGQPLALPLDYACMAASELGNISDRRIYLSLDAKVTGLPKLLVKDTGLNSGFMILQYTSAALVSENKTLCYPASVDSIPTSLGQEDHVSMGSIAGRKALRVVENLEKILAIELLCACQAMDFRRPLKTTPMLEQIHQAVRAKISHTTDDRIFGEDIQVARKMLNDGFILPWNQELRSQYFNEFEVY
jgi:histidine ammonia-lyase